MSDTQELNDFKACVVLYAITYMTESFSEYVLEIVETVRTVGEKEKKKEEHSEGGVLNIPSDEGGENKENKIDHYSEKSTHNDDKDHQGNGSRNGILHTPPRHEDKQSTHTRKTVKRDEIIRERMVGNSDCVSILLFSFLPLFSLSCLALTLVDSAERFSNLTVQLSAVFSGKFGEFLSLFSVEKSLFSMERTARTVYNVKKCRGMVDAVCGKEEVGL